MKTLVKFITTIIIAFGSLLTNAQTTSDRELLKSLDELTSTALETNNIPGMAIAVIKDGRTVVERGYGFADKDAGKIVSSTTGFNVGSISKMLAYLAAKYKALTTA